MHELISHPGLQFYISRLSGTLHYTLTIASRPPKHFSLSDSDFEDVSPQVKAEGFRHLHGTDASAVGLELKIVKNDGVLEIVFEGREGGRAEWRFAGLQEQGSVYAMASVQTERVGVVDGGTQTITATSTSTGVQTETVTQEDVQYRDLTTTLEIDGICIVDVSDSDEYEALSVASSASSTWSDPWPRHIYLKGHKLGRGAATRWGAIHIDRQTRKLRWTESSGESWNKRSVKEVIDLRSASSESHPCTHLSIPPQTHALANPTLQPKSSTKPALPQASSVSGIPSSAKRA